MSLFKELKRRNVIRVAAAYLVISWLLLQIASVLTPALHLPAWVISGIALLLILGFIPTMLFSWAYELTPDGIKKDSDVNPSTSDTTHTAKKLDVITIASVVGIAALIGWQQMKPPVSAGVAPIASAAEPIEVGIKTTNVTTAQDAGADDTSIAVLPFIALSSDKDDEFFGKGIAEELLNSLAQFPELKVAARTSAFAFGNKDVDLREVGEQLGVAHVLEGSVRRSGERLRITAQLIRALDGFHLWSETYERKDTDIFAIQDEIVAELSQVLQFRLGIGAGAGRAANRNVDPRAYEDYLRGLDLWWNRESRENRDKAIRTFRRVTEIAPNFADGWSAYGSSLALSNVSNAPTLTPENYQNEYDNSLKRALELDPDNVRAHASIVFANTAQRINIPLAKKHLQTVLEIAPNDAFTMYTAAVFHYITGNLPQSIEYFDRGVALDPLNQTMLRIRFSAFVSADRYAEAVASVPLVIKCQAGECPSVPALWGLTMASMSASSEAEMKSRRDQFLDNQREADGSSGWLQVMSYHVDSLLGEPVDPAYLETIDFSEFAIQESALVIASILAHHGEEALAVELLFSGLETTSAIFSNTEDLFALASGRLEVPESLRRHPRYHEYWNQPGMAELADVRRANGMPFGLPLPPKDTE